MQEDSTQDNQEDIFAGVLSVLGKNIRNKKKKLEKINTVVKASLQGKSDHTQEQKEMIEGKEKLLSEIQDLQETQNAIKDETRKVAESLKKTHKKEVKQHDDSHEIFADAFLISLVHKHYGQQILDEESADALGKALTAFQLALTPQEVLNYDRVRNGFTFLFNSLLSKSQEIIPGTTKTFANVISAIKAAKDKVTNQQFELPEKVEEQKEEEIIQVEGSAPGEEQIQNVSANQEEAKDEPEAQVNQVSSAVWNDDEGEVEGEG